MRITKLKSKKRRITECVFKYVAVISLMVVNLMVLALGVFTFLNTHEKGHYSSSILASTSSPQVRNQQLPEDFKQIRDEIEQLKQDIDILDGSKMETRIMELKSAVQALDNPVPPILSCSVEDVNSCLVNGSDFGTDVNSTNCSTKSVSLEELVKTRHVSNIQFYCLVRSEKQPVMPLTATLTYNNDTWACNCFGIRASPNRTLPGFQCQMKIISCPTQYNVPI